MAQNEEFNATWFRIPVNRDNWRHFNSKAIIIECPIRVHDLQDFWVQERFVALGWEAMLDVDKEVYPQLVHTFCCNLTGKQLYIGEYKVYSRVGGRDIIFTSIEFGEIIGVSSKGSNIYCPPRTSSKGFFNSTKLAFMKANVIVGGEVNWALFANWRPTPKVLCRIVQYNILPIHGHFNKVSLMQAYTTFFLYIGEKISLPYIMLRQMMACVYCLADGYLFYGKVLTKVFRHIGINLEGEKRMDTHVIPFDRAILEKMKLHEYAGSDQDEAPAAKEDLEEHEENVHKGEDELQEGDGTQQRDEHQPEEGVRVREEEEHSNPFHDFDISDIDVNLMEEDMASLGIPPTHVPESTHGTKSY
ncbi:uncharacterized protein LOC122071352 [Macadamia integrifolia]|uniref:uncharacterized protein LOC122071352 n=1 Tax=Macadamia integrifolia TaxID=60698 RepID=UPI001C500655|nr:uncharacterized protein LOC122071352 [Macadamia integrifolia]